MHSFGCLALGIWGDGRACNFDSTDSIEVLSLNLPGLAGTDAHIRFPITCLSDKQVSPNAWFGVKKLLKWSLQVPATGTPPTERHDHTAWRASDKGRANVAMQRSCLVEVRADWEYMAEVFHLPSHNLGEGCCWTCECTPCEVLGSHRTGQHEVCVASAHLYTHSFTYRT